MGVILGIAGALLLLINPFGWAAGTISVLGIVLGVETGGCILGGGFRLLYLSLASKEDRAIFDVNKDNAIPDLLLYYCEYKGENHDTWKRLFGKAITYTSDQYLSRTQFCFFTITREQYNELFSLLTGALVQLRLHVKT